jgi:hypothetical protein
MTCIICRQEITVQEITVDERRCPTCGREMLAADALAETRVVEGSIELSADGGDGHALAPSAAPHPALVALSRLPALAWRQPVVRTAVKTGASAVALTFALRLAGRIIAGRRARQVARETLLPVLSDLVSPGEGQSRAGRRGRRGEISETFVYIRRTIRL